MDFEVKSVALFKVLKHEFNRTLHIYRANPQLRGGKEGLGQHPACCSAAKLGAVCCNDGRNTLAA